MQRDSDEDAWRAIVENYGERAELGEEPASRTGAETRADTGPEESGAGEPETRPATEDAERDRLERLFRPLPQPRQAEPVGPDDFVAPDPPPLPRPPRDRLLAWTGLFGSPAVLLLCVVAGVSVPPLIGYLLVGSFIGGFLYLVVKLPRGTDIDPWDDGARL